MRAIRLPKLHEIQWLIEPTTELSHPILKRTSFRPKLNHSPKIFIGNTKSTMNRPGMRLLNSLSSPQCAPLHGCQREGGQFALDHARMGAGRQLPRNSGRYRTCSTLCYICAPGIGLRMDFGDIAEALDIPGFHILTNQMLSDGRALVKE